MKNGERVTGRSNAKGVFPPELPRSEKISEELLYWLLAGWRKPDGQTLGCSRKWRSKEGPAQALRSWSVLLTKHSWKRRLQIPALWTPLEPLRILEITFVANTGRAADSSLCTGHQLASSCLVWCPLFTGWLESSFTELGPVLETRTVERTDMSDHRRS